MVEENTRTRKEEETIAELENGETCKKLVDFIPIYIPSSDPPNSTVLHKANVLAPFTRHNYEILINYCKKWIKDPMNVAVIVWLLAVGACLLVFFLFITGLLNHAIPQSSERKEWIETTNQILNALFTIMCMYQHPRLVHHLVLLCRWNPNDVLELRKVYCMHATKRPRERAHVGVVVVLLHVTCFVQYVLCGLYWGYSRSQRPDVGVNLCIGAGIAAPVVAVVYTVVGPLGWRYNGILHLEGEGELQSVDEKLTSPNSEDKLLKWEGALFNCSRDDMSMFFLSFFCTFCTFGSNMERLGLGNKYVHMATFILLCTAPIYVFGIAGHKIHHDVVRDMAKISGVVLCFLGLLYGGLWRTQIRKRIHLPPNTFCFGRATLTDLVQWLFCWSCALAQEVRTGNFYVSHVMKESTKGSVLGPLPREEGGGGGLGSWSRNWIGLSFGSSSSPAKLGGDVGGECGGDELVVVVLEKGWSSCNPMVVPIPLVIEKDGDQ